MVLFRWEIVCYVLQTNLSNEFKKNMLHCIRLDLKSNLGSYDSHRNSNMDARRHDIKSWFEKIFSYCPISKNQMLLDSFWSPMSPRCHWNFSMGDARCHNLKSWVQLVHFLRIWVLVSPTLILANSFKWQLMTVFL